MPMPCLACNTMIDHDEVIEERPASECFEIADTVGYEEGPCDRPDCDHATYTAEVAVWTCGNCGIVQIEPL